MWPESMERMGIVPICKEAAQLLHQHFRLFLPFFLAFYLPASFLSVFCNAFLVPNNFLNFLNSTYTTGHGEEMKDADSILHSLILSQVALTPMFILSTPGVVGFTYVVDYIYSDHSDDDAITRRVFKQLPHAFLRVLVTKIWESLMVLLFTKVPSFPVFYVFYVFYVLWVAGTFTLAVMYELAQFVAVLEQENYGRKALNKSKTYATGRPGTILGVVAFGALVDGLVYFLRARAMALSLVAAVVAASVISVVFSILSAYVALVGIVTYFVCKSGSDDAALSVATAENPHRPLISGSTQVS